jgi:hypothetical protein
MEIPLWAKYGMLGYAVVICLMCSWIFISAHRSKGLVMRDLKHEFASMVDEISSGSTEIQPKRFTVKGDSLLYYPEGYSGEIDSFVKFNRASLRTQNWLLPIKNDQGVIDRIRLLHHEKELTFVVNTTKQPSPTAQPYEVDMTTTTEEELRDYWQKVLPFYGFDVAVPE